MNLLFLAKKEILRTEAQFSNLKSPLCCITFSQQMPVIYRSLWIFMSQLFWLFTESHTLREQDTNAHTLSPKVPNQALAAAERLHHNSSVPELLTSHWQHSRLEKWNGSTICQQLLFFWNFSRFLKQTDRQTDTRINIKLQSFLHWFQYSKLGWFP